LKWGYNTFFEGKKAVFPRDYGKGGLSFYCEKRSKEGVKGISLERGLFTIKLFSRPKKTI
jgi:hypothetical protein